METSAGNRQEGLFLPSQSPLTWRLAGAMTVTSGLRCGRRWLGVGLKGCSDEKRKEKKGRRDEGKKGTREQGKEGSREDGKKDRRKDSEKRRASLALEILTHSYPTYHDGHVDLCKIRVGESAFMCQPPLFDLFPRFKKVTKFGTQILK